MYLPVVFICKILKIRKQLDYNDTSVIFIRNATSLIETKYPSSNGILEIHPSELSCKQDLGQDLGYRNVSRS